MTVTRFDTQEGVYQFQFDALSTSLHSHPAVELLYAEEGKFTISTGNRTEKNLLFAVIDANIQHAVTSSTGHLKVVMIEHHKAIVKEILKRSSIQLLNGIATHKEIINGHYILEEIMTVLNSAHATTDYDERVAMMIQHMQVHDVEYAGMIQTLKQLIHLSESRMSHLFKEQTGISIKKYMVWCRLKKTIRQHLHRDKDLFTSLINSGFYDQPHFNKSFKAMLGVQPARTYNSRIVQF